MCPLRRNIRKVMTDRVRNSCTIYLVRNEIKCMTAPNEIIPNIISIKTIQSVVDIKKKQDKISNHPISFWIKTVSTLPEVCVVLGRI